MQVDTCTTPRGFTVEDLQVLTGISAQAAIAVKNLQLYEAIEAETARRISLQRYFSPGLVDMLMSGEVTATLGGDAYQGTILLADIIGFTAMSEKMPPARVVAKLNRYFTIMQKVIYAHGGNVDKFNGDGLMAFWGVPRAGAHDESDAVLTAIRMQQKLWLFNLQLCAEGRQPVHMGIGLNSGEFIAGNIGSEDKIEFTLIGDTVNLTARIEHLAGRYQVLVSEATWFPIKDLVCAVRLPPMMVKGKSHPVTLYSIRAIHDRHQGGYALALPCRVLDAQGNCMGHGILTGSSPGDPGHGLVFNTGLPLASGATLTCSGLCPNMTSRCSSRRWSPPAPPCVMRGPVIIARPCSPSPTVPLRLFSPLGVVSPRRRPGVPHVRNNFDIPPASCYGPCYPALSAVYPEAVSMPQQLSTDQARQRAHMPQGTATILDTRTLATAHRRLTQLLRPGLIVLDVGCGTGAVTRGIAEAVAPDGLALGLDIHAGLLAQARRAHGRVPGLAFALGDAYNLPCRDTFDVVTAARVLQWLAHPLAALRAMWCCSQTRRVCRDTRIQP